MSTPRPGSWIKPKETVEPQSKDSSTKPVIKKPFVRSEHLTQRPLKDDENLRNLRDAMTKENPPKRRRPTKPNKSK